jgi:hypothetical protein
MRNEYRGLAFSPGGPSVIDGNFNLWRGFAVEPMAGDWSLMQSHILQVLANGDEAYAKYILRWIAWAVQNPHKQAEVALVLRGGQGTGKGALGRTMCSLYRQHGLHINSALHLAGRFNAHLRDVCLLFADEAVHPGDQNSLGILKGVITEPTLPIEGKGKDLVAVQNCLKVIMASNEDFVVPVARDDRRFAVFDVSEAHKQDKSYFSALLGQMENGGLSAMLHYLLAMQLDGWHPRNDIPKTEARNAQKGASLKGFSAVFYDFLRAGQIPYSTRLAQDLYFISTSEFQQDASNRMRREDISLSQVGALLGELGFKKKRDASAGGRGFILPPLPEARAAWDSKMFPVAWDDVDEWSMIPPRVQPPTSR